MKPTAQQFAKYLKADDVCRIQIGHSQSRYTKFPIQLDVRIDNRAAFPNAGMRGGFSHQQFVGYAKSVKAAEARAKTLVRAIKKLLPIEIEIRQAPVSQPG